MNKHLSDAKKIYYYHVMGFTIPYINKKLNLKNVSASLSSWGVPSDGGNNKGSLSDFKDAIQENDCINHIREWLEGTSKGNSTNSIENLRDFLETKIKPKPTRITRIKLDNFKSIQHADLEVGKNLTCLIGKNNSGKSSIIQGIQFLTAAAQSLAKEIPTKYRDELDSENKVSTSVSPNQILYTPTENIYKLRHEKELGRPETGNSIDLSITSQHEEAKIQIFKGHSKDVRIMISGAQKEIDSARRTNSLIKSIASPESHFSIYVPGISGIPVTEEFKSSGVINRLSTRGESNSVLRNIIWRLSGETTEESNRSQRDRSNWNKFQESISRVYPGLKIEGYFDYLSGENVETNLSINSSDSFSLDTAGTGLLQTIQIFAYIYNFKPQLLLLDEPDSHIDPEKQKLLIQELLRSSRNENFQIILTTHSRKLLESIKEISEKNKFDSRLYLCTKNGVEARQNIDFEIFSAIDDLGDIADFRKKKLFVLTEDSVDSSSSKFSDKAQIGRGSKFILPIIQACGIRESDTYFFSYRNSNFIRNLSNLINLIKRENSQSVVIVHRDSDYLDKISLEELRNSILKDGADFFYTPKNAIESPYCTQEHLKEVLYKFGKYPGDEKFKTIYTAAIEEAMQVGTKNMKNTYNREFKEIYYAKLKLENIRSYQGSSSLKIDETIKNLEEIISFIEEMNSQKVSAIVNSGKIDELAFSRGKTLFGIILNRFSLTEDEILTPTQHLREHEFVEASKKIN